MGPVLWLVASEIVSGASPSLDLGNKLRTSRSAAGLSQQAVANRIGVSQMTVSNWERGVSVPSNYELEQLGSFLDLAEGYEVTVAGDELSAFGEWLEQTRREQGLTRKELAERSRVSEVQVGNIERGATQNPRADTRRRLQEALQVELPPEVEAETVAAAEIPGVGALEDFDPHDRRDWPDEPGVYVLYDISERPIYVGRSNSVSRRLTNHADRFWYRAPIVQTASFVRVDDSDLRDQLEQVLIKFLKSNAVINQQGVNRR